MNIEKRLERLEAGRNRMPQRLIIVQSVERDENGRLVALGESRFNTGSGEDCMPYVEYEKPILLQGENGV